MVSIPISTIGDQPGVTVETGVTSRGFVTDLPNAEVDANLAGDEAHFQRSSQVDLLSISNSAWKAIPITGSAEYTGLFALSVNNGGVTASGPLVDKSATVILNGVAAETHILAIEIFPDVAP